MLIALAATPRLYVWDNFATDEEIERVLELGSDYALIERLGIASKHDATGFSFEMPVDIDPLVTSLIDRTHQTLGFENVLGQTMRFRRYEASEGHPPHLDCFQAGAYHLVATAMIYLTDGVEGGGTTFPRALPEPVTIPPRRGRLALWFNYFPNGMPDPSTYHEGLPLVSGVKATLTNFVYRPLEDAATTLESRTASDAEREQLCASSA